MFLVRETYRPLLLDGVNKDARTPRYSEIGVSNQSYNKDKNR